MRTWKVELELELLDDVDCLQWVYQAIREQLEDRELLLSGRHIETTEEIV